MDEGALWRSPGLLGPRLRLQVTRPRDHLVLQVSAAQCEVEVGEDRVPRLRPTQDATAARLIIGLPPQHVYEQVFQEHISAAEAAAAGPPAKAGDPEQPHLPAGARFSGPSRIVFVLAPTDSVELTVDGILTAMSRLSMAVVPLAEPRFVWRLLDDGEPNRYAGVLAATRTPAGPELDVATITVSAAAPAIDRVRVTRLLTAAGLANQVATMEPVARQAILDASPRDRQRLISAVRDGIEIGPRIPFPEIGRPAARAPQLGETAIEVPSRLQLSPSVDGAWAHATAVDPTPGATVELWHTRLGVRGGPADAPTVDEVSTQQRTVRAVWTRDLEHGPDGTGGATVPFRSSLSVGDRVQIVAASTGHAGTSWRLPPPNPVDVKGLALTSLGAFMNVRGHWDVLGAPLTEWQHRTTLGRDQFVRVVKKGYLCPLGHRAVYVKETMRKAEPSLPNGDFAILWQRHYIIMRERVRDYGGRDFPFVQATVDPHCTPDLDDPGEDPLFFWPEIGGQPYPFAIVGTDQNGESKPYPTPLLFVLERQLGQGQPNQGHPTAAEVYEQFALTPDGLHDLPASPYAARVRHLLGGQRVAMAPKGPSGEATYETRTLRFRVEPDVDTCEPALLFGELVIPAVAATTGKKDPLSLTYADAYLQHGFDSTDNAGEVVLAPAEGAPAAKLAFDSSDRSGGFLNPSQHIAGIARGTGPVSDLAAAASGAAADPASLFAGLGKILGLFELSDILPDLSPDQIPSYAAQLLDVAGSLSGGIDRAIALLGGANPVAAQLQAAATGLAALMHATPTPAPADFAAFIGSTLGPAVTAGLAPGSLATLGKAEAAIVQRALSTVDTIVHPPPGSPIDPAALLADLAAGRPIASVLNHVHLEWRPPITQWPGGPKGNAIFLPSSPESLLLAVDVRGGDLVPQPSVEVLAQLTDFTLQLVPGMPLVHIPFKRLYFRASTGAKTEIDVDLDQLEWLGVLGFVDKLRQLIPTDGFSDPPSVAVDSQGISAGFSVGLPNVAVGVFNLSNLSMAADIKLPFIGDAPTVGFSFCSRERPFTLAVLFLGGGGFFGLRLSPKKLVLLEAAVEFGATLALDFGVASGSVSCMAGVYLRLEADDGSLTGYLRIRGEVDVLGLISASIEMYMGLTYEFGSGKVIGKATITVEVEVLLFSASVSISAERKFAGSKGDPTFADALGPYVEPDCPWITYCQAFAEL